MSSRYGMTVDQALARIMELPPSMPDQERRAEIRRILGKVRSLAYTDGGDDERYSE